MKGVLPWLVRWACRVGTRDVCPALDAVVGPVLNIFFLTIAKEAGQAVVLTSVS